MTPGSDHDEQRPIRLLICEDQTLMREGLHTVLTLEPGFEVVGEALDGAQAVQLAEHLRPDIVLMDVQMPRQNGVQATAAITARNLPCRVIILTTFDKDRYLPKEPLRLSVQQIVAPIQRSAERPLPYRQILRSAGQC